MFEGSYEPVDYEGLPDAVEWSEEGGLGGEYAVLGFYVSGHPLEKYAGRLKELKAVDLGGVEGHRSGEEITVAGIIVSIRPMRSRKGARWAIFTLQDLTGIQELLAFPEACARMEGILKVGTALLIKGRVNIEEAGTRVVVVEAHPLEQMAERGPSLMRVRVDLAVGNELTLDRLQELFERKPGNCPLAFELWSPAMRRGGTRWISSASCSPISWSCTATGRSAKTPPSSPALRGFTDARLPSSVTRRGATPSNDCSAISASPSRRAIAKHFALWSSRPSLDGRFLRSWIRKGLIPALMPRSAARPKPSRGI